MSKLVSVQVCRDGSPMYRVIVEYYDGAPMRFDVSTRHIEAFRSSLINDNVKRLYVDPVMVDVREEVV